MLVEENLVQAWLMVSEAYVRHAARPFRLDAATLRRNDDPPDYTAFREAAINLLIHQDYGDRNRTAFIRSFRDRTVFWNPGDAFATTAELLDATAKHLRNPAIVTAFRRIGLSEQAGTGMRAIFRNWQSLGHVPPVIENDKARKAFELRLLRQELLGGEQQQLQVLLGARLDERQARVFAFACRNGQVSLTDAKALTGGTGPEARTALDTLVAQELLRPVVDGLRYRLTGHVEARRDAHRQGQSRSDHVRDGHADMVADQDERTPGSGDMSTAHVRSRNNDMSTAHRQDMSTAHRQDMSTAHAEDRRNMSTAHVERTAETPAGRHEPLTKLSATHRRILERCEVPCRLAELMNALGAINRGHFKKRHLDPLIRAGIVTMTNPENPRAPGQRYVLTAAGLALRAARSRKGQEDEGGHAG